MQKRRRRSIIGLITAAAFAVVQAGAPLPALAVLKEASPEVKVPAQFELNLPPDLGTIQSLTTGTGPTLIHLQDAHGNYEAQKKIAEILHYLKQNYGVKLLLLEGDAAKLNPENVRLFPKHPDITREVLDELAKDAIAQGEELFLLDHPDVEVYGIENLEAYAANGESFRAVLTQQEKTAGFIRDMNMQIERLTGPYLNKDLRAFLKRLEDFEEKQLPIVDWLNYLKSQAKTRLGFDLGDPAYQIDWPTLIRIYKLGEFELKIDMKAFVKERDEFLSVIRGLSPQGTVPLAGHDFEQIKDLLTSPLSRHQLPDPETGLLFEKMAASLPKDFNYDAYPNVKIFIGHLILQSEVKAERLMEEMDRLTGQISAKLAQTDEEKKILGLLKDHRLLKRLFALELSPEDYDVIADQMNVGAALRGRPQDDDDPEITGQPHRVAPTLRPSSVIQRFLSLNGTKRVRDTQFSHVEEIDSLFEKAMEFYRGVKERDQWMLENIEARLKETGADKAVVITGGFHAEPFQNFFARKNYNYALIAPKITTPEGREAYVRTALNLQLKGPASLTASTRKLPSMVALGFDTPALRDLGINSDLVKLAILGKTSVAAARRRMGLPEVINSEGSRLSGTKIERWADGVRVAFPDGFMASVPTAEATFQTEVTRAILDTNRVQILQEASRSEARLPRSGGEADGSPKKAAKARAEERTAQENENAARSVRTGGVRDTTSVTAKPRSTEIIPVSPASVNLNKETRRAWESNPNSPKGTQDLGLGHLPRVVPPSASVTHLTREQDNRTNINSQLNNVNKLITPRAEVRTSNAEIVTYEGTKLEGIVLADPEGMKKIRQYLYDEVVKGLSQIKFDLGTKGFFSFNLSSEGEKELKNTIRSFDLLEEKEAHRDFQTILLRWLRKYNLLERLWEMEDPQYITVTLERTTEVNRVNIALIFDWITPEAWKPAKGLIDQYEKVTDRMDNDRGLPAGVVPVSPEDVAPYRETFVTLLSQLVQIAPTLSSDQKGLLAKIEYILSDISVRVMDQDFVVEEAALNAYLSLLPLLAHEQKKLAFGFFLIGLDQRNVLLGLDHPLEVRQVGARGILELWKSVPDDELPNIAKYLNLSPKSSRDRIKQELENFSRAEVRAEGPQHAIFVNIYQIQELHELAARKDLKVSDYLQHFPQVNERNLRRLLNQLVDEGYLISEQKPTQVKRYGFAKPPSEIESVFRDYLIALRQSGDTLIDISEAYIGRASLKDKFLEKLVVDYPHVTVGEGILKGLLARSITQFEIPLHPSPEQTELLHRALKERYDRAGRRSEARLPRSGGEADGSPKKAAEARAEERTAQENENAARSVRTGGVRDTTSVTAKPRSTEIIPVSPASVNLNKETRRAWESNPNSPKGTQDLGLGHLPRVVPPSASVTHLTREQDNRTNINSQLNNVNKLITPRAEVRIDEATKKQVLRDLNYLNYAVGVLFSAPDTQAVSDAIGRLKALAQSQQDRPKLEEVLTELKQNPNLWPYTRITRDKLIQRLEEFLASARATEPVAVTPVQPTQVASVAEATRPKEPVVLAAVSPVSETSQPTEPTVPSAVLPEVPAETTQPTKPVETVVVAPFVRVDVAEPETPVDIQIQGIKIYTTTAPAIVSPLVEAINAVLTRPLSDLFPEKGPIQVILARIPNVPQPFLFALVPTTPAPTGQVPTPVVFALPTVTPLSPASLPSPLRIVQLIPLIIPVTVSPASIEIPLRPLTELPNILGLLRRLDILPAPSLVSPLAEVIAQAVQRSGFLVRTIPELLLFSLANPQVIREIPGAVPALIELFNAFFRTTPRSELRRLGITEEKIGELRQIFPQVAAEGIVPGASRAEARALQLTRKVDEKIAIGGQNQNEEITVKVVEIRGKKVRLNIEAPMAIPVFRAELLRENRAEVRGGIATLILTPNILPKVFFATSPEPSNVSVLVLIANLQLGQNVEGIERLAEQVSHIRKSAPLDLLKEQAAKKESIDVVFIRSSAKIPEAGPHQTVLAGFVSGNNLVSFHIPQGLGVSPGQLTRAIGGIINHEPLPVLLPITVEQNRLRIEQVIPRSEARVPTEERPAVGVGPEVGARPAPVTEEAPSVPAAVTPSPTQAEQIPAPAPVTANATEVVQAFFVSRPPASPQVVVILRAGILPYGLIPLIEPFALVPGALEQVGAFFGGIPLRSAAVTGPKVSPTALQESMGIPGPVQVTPTEAYLESLRSWSRQAAPELKGQVALGPIFVQQYLKNPPALVAQFRVSEAMKGDGKVAPFILMVGNKADFLSEVRQALTNKNNGLGSEARVLARRYAENPELYFEIVEQRKSETYGQALNRYLETRPRVAILDSQALENVLSELVYRADEKLILKNIEFMPQVSAELGRAFSGVLGIEDRDERVDFLKADLIQRLKMVVSIIRHGSQTRVIFQSFAQFVETLRNQRFVLIAA